MGLEGRTGREELSTEEKVIFFRAVGARCGG